MDDCLGHKVSTDLNNVGTAFRCNVNVNRLLCCTIMNTGSGISLVNDGQLHELRLTSVPFSCRPVIAATGKMFGISQCCEISVFRLKRTF